LGDFDELVAAAHERGLRVLLDLIPCHTSIEHPWFREHPDWYIWSPVDGPPNNWVSAFGGSAWSRDELTGRWYLHSFYPEQPDLDWRNPAVVEAFQSIVRFWLDRGVDGFRLDAIDRLATRLGPANVRAAAKLLLTLPGTAFIYQGDEIGLANGPGADPPYDRAGRDPMRHPMQWDTSPTGGFTSGVPWLPAVDPAERNVEAQRDDP